MFSIIIALSITGYSFGYDIGISNATKKTLVIRLAERRLGESDEFFLVRPGKRIVSRFPGAWCLETISWSEFNPAEKSGVTDSKYAQYKGKNLIEIEAMGGRSDFDTYRDVFKPLASEYALHPVQMHMMPSDLYKKTAKAATAIVNGLDTLGCKALEIALQASPEGAISEGGKKLLDAITKPKQEATDKTKEAIKKVEDSKKDPTDTKKKEDADKATADATIAQKVVKLGTFDLELAELLFDVEGTNPFEYRTLPVASAISKLKTNKALFDDATFSIMETHLSKGENKEAMETLESYIKELKGKSSTKTSIEYDAMIQGCRSCNLNTNIDIGKKDTTDKTKAGTEEKNCSFGLGVIAEASAELAGISLCKSREFIIIDTGSEAELTLPGGRKVKAGYDELIAVTEKGG